MHVTRCDDDLSDETAHARSGCCCVVCRAGLHSLYICCTFICVALWPQRHASGLYTRLVTDRLHKSHVAAEEHEARLKAESLSQDQVQRLAVHSEQVAEYAEQKARDLEQLKQQVRRLLRTSANLLT